MNIFTLQMTSETLPLIQFAAKNAHGIFGLSSDAAIQLLLSSPSFAAEKLQMMFKQEQDFLGARVLASS